MSLTVSNALGSDVRVRSALVVIADPDTDQDGMTDWWERRYFGGILAAAPGKDADGDGLPNGSEFKANTNPRDPRSTLVFAGMSRLADGQLSFTWQASVGRRYVLETTEDLRLPTVPVCQRADRIQ